MGDTPTCAGWAVLELMGHRRLGGYVVETQIAGQGFLRIDVPSPCPGVAADYCDIHGTCKCLRREDGERIRHQACPLHGDSSPCGEGAATQFYPPSSVYCLTPTSEEAARAVAKSNRPAPVHRYELPRLGTGTCRDCGGPLDSTGACPGCPF